MACNCFILICVFPPPSPPLTEQQATVTIPGTNLTIPLSALTGTQPMLIPGSNISLGGLQIPVSQGLTLPGAGCALQLSAGGAGAPGEKADAAKDVKPATSPPQPGRSTYRVWRELFLSCTFVEHVDSSHSFSLYFCGLFRTTVRFGPKVLSIGSSRPRLSILSRSYVSFAWCFTNFTMHYHYSLPLSITTRLLSRTKLSSSCNFPLKLVHEIA